jgi:HEAT repeat protein
MQEIKNLRSPCDLGQKIYIVKKWSQFYLMDLQQIETDLQNPDFKYRTKAVSALRNYPPEVAVPILHRHLKDPEFLVRSFIARELGYQKNPDSFAALLQLLEFDNTPNVQAEAANSISLFGRLAASHLVKSFIKDDHWLLRRSILAGMVDMECPDELYEVCVVGVAGDDLTVMADAIGGFSHLANSEYRSPALANILSLQDHEKSYIRIRIAYALKQFNEPAAKEALAKLRQDSNHQVVGAAMEDLLP